MSSRTTRVTLLSGVAAGALALSAVAGLPSAGAAPVTTPAATSAPTSAAAAAPSAKRSRVTKVRNEKQLRRAVRRSNQTAGRDVIKVRDSISFADRRIRGGAMFGDLDILGDLKIVGGRNTIDANQIERIFDVRPEGHLYIKRITLTGGSAPLASSGGAIRNRGITMVRHSKITDSVVTGEAASGGAIMNAGGRVVVARTRLARNQANRAGGAIEALGGRTVVRHSRLMRNSAGAEPGNGGALHLTGAGTVVVRYSRVFGNTATAEGGGLWNSAEGTFRVIASTLWKNTASGADADQGGGALYNDGGDLTVTGSRLEENSADGAAGSGGGILTNGGSLVVNDSKVLRNRATRAGAGIEAVAGDTLVRRTTLAVNRTGSAPGNGGAVHLTGVGTVEVRDSMVRYNRAVEGGGLWNSADGTMRVIDTELFRNFARGDASDQGGGALYNDGGSLTVRGSRLDDNSTRGDLGSGGGIFNNAGNLDVSDSMLVDNSANRAGGAIEALGGDTMVDTSTLDGNQAGSAPGNGGAVHLTGAGTVDVANSVVSNNTATAEGGGLWNSAVGTLTVTDSVLTGNTAGGAAADQGGGALYNDGGNLTVTGSTLTGNTATGAAGSGGGILNNAGTLNLSDSTLSDNSAVRAGGGVETNVGTVAISDVDMTDNSAGSTPGNGGALHLTGAATVSWDGGTVTGNSATNEGGGLWNSATGNLVATVVISDNTAPTGPNAYNDGGMFVLNGAPVPPGTGV